jgi:hypothetical protein
VDLRDGGWCLSIVSRASQFFGCLPADNEVVSNFPQGGFLVSHARKQIGILGSMLEDFQYFEVCHREDWPRIRWLIRRISLEAWRRGYEDGLSDGLRDPRRGQSDARG